MVCFNVDVLLKKKGRTRYWLAKEMGTDFNTINKIVGNKARSVRIATLDKLCQALECSAKDLFRDAT